MAEWCTKQSFSPFAGVMKPKPLVSLNHFTVPVVRIAELLIVFVVGGTDGRRSTCPREWRPHAGAALRARHCAACAATRGRTKKGPRNAGPNPSELYPRAEARGASLGR